MQKFTRALTREIEIGGERLALTLAADGVSVRPVGSRKPPAALPWDAVLCALVGKPHSDPPTADEVAAALAALHALKAAKPAPPPPPAAEPQAFVPSAAKQPSIHELMKLLGELDRWLAAHRPRYFQGLLPPAGDSDLEALGQVFGAAMPMELRRWLDWHNGQAEDFIGSFKEAFNLMSAAQIAAAWQDRQMHPEPGWDANWIPLLDDDQGNLIVLDSAKPGCPVREVWRGRHDHPVTAPSLEAWVGELLRDAESGRYAEDPERGEFRLVRSGT